MWGQSGKCVVILDDGMLSAYKCHLSVWRTRSEECTSREPRHICIGLSRLGSKLGRIETRIFVLSIYNWTSARTVNAAASEVVWLVYEVVYLQRSYILECLQHGKVYGLIGVWILRGT